MMPDKIKKKVKKGIIAHIWLVFPKILIKWRVLKIAHNPRSVFNLKFYSNVRRKKKSISQFLNGGSLVGTNLFIYHEYVECSFQSGNVWAKMQFNCADHFYSANASVAAMN